MHTAEELEIRRLCMDGLRNLRQCNLLRTIMYCVVPYVSRLEDSKATLALLSFLSNLDNMMPKENRRE
jgi:hypothetical protein